MAKSFRSPGKRSLARIFCCYLSTTQIECCYAYDISISNIDWTLSRLVWLCSAPLLLPIHTHTRRWASTFWMLRALVCYRFGDNKTDYHSQSRIFILNVFLFESSGRGCRIHYHQICSKLNYYCNHSCARKRDGRSAAQIWQKYTNATRVRFEHARINQILGWRAGTGRERADKSTERHIRIAFCWLFSRACDAGGVLKVASKISSPINSDELRQRFVAT